MVYTGVHSKLIVEQNNQLQFEYKNASIYKKIETEECIEKYSYFISCISTVVLKQDINLR